MCMGSWDCPCDGPEYECDECQKRQSTLDECRVVAKALFHELYISETPDLECVDECMNQLVSYLNAIDVWPKDANNEYIKLKFLTQSTGK